MAVLVSSERNKGAHWYTQDGLPMHEVPRAKEKDGEKMRPTAMADARKFGLFPSVTGILEILDKPQLERWKINQAIIATARVIRQDTESVDYWCRRVVDESNKQVDEAADLGSMIHKSLECVIHDMNMDRCHPDAVSYIHPVLGWFAEKKLNIVQKEKIVVNSVDGYAGTLDLAGTFNTSAGEFKFVFDFKSRKTKPNEPVKPYDFQICQIAAYAKVQWEEDFSLGRVYGGNLFISSTEPGRIEFIRYNPDEVIEAYNIFRAACTIWRYVKGFDPRKVKAIDVPVPSSSTPDMPLLIPSESKETAKEPSGDTIRDRGRIQEERLVAFDVPVTRNVKHDHEENSNGWVAIKYERDGVRYFAKTECKYINFLGVTLAIHRPVKIVEGKILLHKGKWRLTDPVTGMSIPEVEIKNPGNSQSEWLTHAFDVVDSKPLVKPFPELLQEKSAHLPEAPHIATIDQIII